MAAAEALCFSVAAQVSEVSFSLLELPEEWSSHQSDPSVRDLSRVCQRQSRRQLEPSQKQKTDGRRPLHPFGGSRAVALCPPAGNSQSQLEDAVASAERHCRRPRAGQPRRRATDCRLAWGGLSQQLPGGSSLPGWLPAVWPGRPVFSRWKHRVLPNGRVSPA